MRPIVTIFYIPKTVIGIVPVFDILSMTGAVNPAIKYRLSGCLAHSNILTRRLIRDSRRRHSVERVISIRVCVTEEAAILHVLAMSLSDITESTVPFKPG